jgi:hypothetical protein
MFLSMGGGNPTSHSLSASPYRASSDNVRDRGSHTALSYPSANQPLLFHNIPRQLKIEMRDEDDYSMNVCMESHSNESVTERLLCYPTVNESRKYMQRQQGTGESECTAKSSNEDIGVLDALDVVSSHGRFDVG